MSAPVLNTAGDTTTHRLGCFDVNQGTAAAPSWVTTQYVDDYDLQTDNGVLVDATVFADGGYTGQDKVGTAWALAVVLNHMSVPGSNPPIYDPTHDWLEQHGVGQLGAANRVQLRMYDYDVNDATGIITPRGQAYFGTANYSWPGYGSGKATDARMVSITFSGKGKLVKITHPYALPPQVPSLYTVQGSPFAAAGGTPFRLTGSGFTGATAVTIGGTAVTSFKIWNDGEITGVAAAHSAASGLAVVVTNGVGPSVGGPTAAYV